MRRRDAGALALLLLSSLVAAAACASTEDAAPTETPTVILEAGTESPDAAAEASSEAGIEIPDAGPCSTSGVCIVPAPIDTQINVTSVWGSGANDVWAVGTNRTILHYDGNVWEKAAPFEDESTDFTLRAVWLGAADDVWVGSGPVIYHSTGWKGPTATEWKTGVFIESVSVTGISGKDGRVVIARQVLNNIFEYLPSAVTCRGWSGDGLVEPAMLDTYMFREDGSDGLWSIAMTRADEAWATSIGAAERPGSRVVRLHLVTPDGGDPDAGTPTWEIEEHDSHAAKNLYGVWGNEDVVWLVGEGGVLRRITRANVPSRVFETVSAPVTADLRGVYGFAADDVWAVGDDATVLHYDGKTWTKVATAFDAATVKPKLFSVWGSSPADVWIGGNGVMLHFERKAP